MLDLPDEVTDVNVLRLQPDDVVVVRCDEALQLDVADAVRRQVMTVFPDHQVLVLAGMHLEVARPDPEL